MKLKANRPLAGAKRRNCMAHLCNEISLDPQQDKDDSRMKKL
jgi:hypothetical protein